MKIIVKKTLEFDDQQERNRLQKAFKGECLKRQLSILDAFCNKEWDKVIELYNALPYSEEDDCPEQEYVGLYLIDFFKETQPFIWPNIRGTFNNKLSIVDVEIEK